MEEESRSYVPSQGSNQEDTSQTQRPEPRKEGNSNQGDMTVGGDSNE